MHSLMRHSHDDEPHSHPETGPQTTGLVLNWGRRYDWVVQIMALGQAGRLRRKTVEFAQITPGERILDVGCGTGDLTLRAAERAGSTGQVCGIDPGPEMITTARRKADRKHVAVDFRVGVIEQLPYPDDSFDVVLSSLMMHHLPGDLKPIGLAEVRRVLKPTGRLIIVDMKGLLEQQGIIPLVKAAGFTRTEMRGLWFNQLGLIRAV
ncbi:demethylmenaquinone methyltransferase / 2-methoxy-6-polyprenyl-1,4-benzoquinol methylase [Thermoflexales bacterium]|nr:demethylmenaquinone methyltransferase / 2-methoxy-6-polyprenyl-1,4-benzoquinol methylase [Thermoflexales bacterium]